MQRLIRSSQIAIALPGNYRVGQNNIFRAIRAEHITPIEQRNRKNAKQQYNHDQGYFRDGGKSKEMQLLIEYIFSHKNYGSIRISQRFSI